jgi:hypothetical protein
VASYQRVPRDDAKRAWRLRRKIRWLFLGWLLLLLITTKYGPAILFLGLLSISDKAGGISDVSKAAVMIWNIAVVGTFVFTIFAGIVELRARLRFEKLRRSDEVERHEC